MLLSNARALHHHALLRKDEGDAMKETSKILDEACEDVAVVSASLTHMRPRRRRRKVAVGLSLEAKREVLVQFIPQYQDAVGTQKRVLLDDFTRLTEYHRTYAIWLFNHQTPKQHPPARIRRRDYGAEVEEVLVQVWNAANRLCSKLLIPSLPMFLDALERHEHLHLTPECRTRLLLMSTATADRLLRPHRQQELRVLRSTRAGTLLKRNVMNINTKPVHLVSVSILIYTRPILLPQWRHHCQCSVVPVRIGRREQRVQSEWLP